MLQFLTTTFNYLLEHHTLFNNPFIAAALLLFNIVAFGSIFRLVGGWIPNLIRCVPVIAIILIIGTQHPNIYEFAAYMYAFYTLRLLPTNALMSAHHGMLPTRTDGKWQWMQQIAFLMSKGKSGYWFGICYGIIRGLCVIPAVIYLAHYVAVWKIILFVIGALSQGLIYYATTQYSTKFTTLFPTKVAEICVGIVFGILV